MSIDEETYLSFGGGIVMIAIFRFLAFSAIVIINIVLVVVDVPGRFGTAGCLIGVINIAWCLRIDLCLSGMWQVTAMAR